MVIGNGMLARQFGRFADDDNVLLFASGVSNSKEQRPEPFARERALLAAHLAQAGHRRVVYFSTCSIDDPTEQGAPYIAHKLALEELIAQRAERYLICRTSNVVGGPGNPHTVLNYFYDKCRSGTPFDVWTGATRNLIGLADVDRIVSALLTDASAPNRRVNVAFPAGLSPVQIVRCLERFLGRSAQYRLVERGQPFAIDAPESARILRQAGITADPEQYLADLLTLYYV